jgi:hypothetical protein
MRTLLLLLLPVSACDPDSLQWANQGRLEVGDGQSCVIDEPTSVGFGFCLQADNTFSAGGSGDCGDVTVWLDGGALSFDGDFDLQSQSTSLDTGLGAVWVRTGGESYASTTGSATLLNRNDGVVVVSFEAQLEVFVGGDPGPTASGIVLCDLN